VPQRALVIGQKSGMVHAVDPNQEGKVLWQTRAGEGSALGGSQCGAASDRQKVYVAISDLGIGVAPDPKSPPELLPDAGSKKWRRLARVGSQSRQDHMGCKAQALRSGEDGLFPRAIGCRQCDFLRGFLRRR
jgi:hypothetical protein